MPNIAITTFCNLKCKYCFADDMICEQHENISVDNFKVILDWLSRSPENHIGIIGGEPTLHPHFDEIMREVNTFCREQETDCTLFTNGIYLGNNIQYIGNSTGVLINCNAPDEMTPEQYSKFMHSIEKLKYLDWFHPGMQKANLGCNIYMQRNDYGYIWNLIEYTGTNHLRVSVTAPTEAEYKQNKESYYSNLKNIFLEFVHRAKDIGIRLGADCNQIPDCYFNPKEIELIYEVMPDRHVGICEPVIDITPNFTATACFGCYEPVDCSLFENVIDLRRYLLHKRTYPRVEKNCTGKCKSCKMHDLLLCQGGCLAFADGDNV